jgi:hypothetical protein
MGTEMSKKNLEAYPHMLQNKTHVYGNWNDGLYETFINNFKEYEKYMTILQGKSKDMIPLLPNDMDIIIIDASHAYSDVMSDIKLSKDKLANIGILCGDDCEDIHLANTFNPVTEDTISLKDYLEFDTVVLNNGKGIHAGVIQAVYDSFRGEELFVDGIVWCKIISK